MDTSKGIQKIQNAFKNRYPQSQTIPDSWPIKVSLGIFGNIDAVFKPKDSEVLKKLEENHYQCLKDGVRPRTSHEKERAEEAMKKFVLKNKLDEKFDQFCTIIVGSLPQFKKEGVLFKLLFRSVDMPFEKKEILYFSRLLGIDAIVIEPGVKITIHEQTFIE